VRERCAKRCKSQEEGGWSGLEKRGDRPEKREEERKHPPPLLKKKK